MKDRTRAGRNAVLMDPKVLWLFETEQGAWYETPEEVERGLAWGREKAALLRWVRRKMGRHLTARERRCVELYFFEGLTYREIGRQTNTNASSAFRAVARSLRKLREQAEQDGPSIRGRVRRGASRNPGV